MGVILNLIQDPSKPRLRRQNLSAYCSPAGAEWILIKFRITEGG